MEKLKVLFHLDEINKWDLSLKNIKNLIKAGEDYDLDIVLVANGPGVGGLTKSSDHREDIMDLIAKGVEFSICQNAMLGAGLGEKDIIEGLNIVGAGVLEIVLKQKEGYFYIRP